MPCGTGCIFSEKKAAGIVGGHDEGGHVMSVLSGLQPADVFGYFEKLCAVPHGSGNT